MVFFTDVPFQLYLERLPLALYNTAWLTAGAVLLGLVEAIGLALARRSRFRLVSVAATGAVEIGRAIPLLPLLEVVYFGLLALALNVDPLIAGLVAIGVTLGFFMAELIRSGIEAVPRGVIEAAEALGMSGWTLRRRIIVPIALRVMLPAIGQLTVGTLINTSFVSAIGGREITNVGRSVIDFYFATQIWWVVAATYFIVAFPMSRLFSLLERRLRVDF